MLRKLIDYPGPLWKAYALFAWTLLAGSVLIWGPFLLAAILLGASMNFQTRVIAYWMKLILRFFRIRIHITGGEDYKAEESCLIVSNHQSLMDIPAAFSAFSGNLRMVAKAELFKIPIFGRCMKNSGFIPIQRERASKADVLRSIREKIEQGLQVWVAPEGTRSQGKSIGRYKKGSFGIALQNQIPVIPFVVIDSFQALTRDSFFPHVGATVHVAILKSLNPKDYKSREELALDVQIRSQQVIENFFASKKSVVSQKMRSAAKFQDRNPSVD